MNQLFELHTFTCEDCNKELPIDKKVSNFADIPICEDCLSAYPNQTGYCSVECRVSGKCDESC
jgi:hypothetical protein